ncbi:hypothetical protein WJX74_002546 [Apatococcus lobatus]|uniref:ubiquitinyl hydrolase 1 n=1 Tax=Apatococcus lobatus TaxID=904363 RepID=A0AAW1QYM8_9CHLO
MVAEGASRRLGTSGRLRPSPQDQAKLISELQEEPRKAHDSAFLMNMQWWKEWRALAQPGPDRYAERTQLPYDPGLSPQEFDAALAATPLEGIYWNSMQPNAPMDAGSHGPGPISNTKLQELIDGHEDLENFVAGSDFVVLSSEAWKKLRMWYGGGPELEFVWVPRGLSSDTPLLKITLRHISIKLVHSQNGVEQERPPDMAVDVLDTMDVFVAKLCGQCSCAMSDTEIELEVVDSAATFAREDEYVYNHVSNGQSIALAEVKSTQGPFLSSMFGSPQAVNDADTEPQSPVLVHSENEIIDSSKPFIQPYAIQTHPAFNLMSPARQEDEVVQGSGAARKKRGHAGLTNLGNTCFMNSSLQCLAHTVPLMRVFLEEAYKADLNVDNPLGMRGELATSFGMLMDRLWAEGTTAIKPQRFKAQLAKFAPQFQGYSQQDSQELVIFLLDGLHEDLNRVQNKPYVVEGDDDGRPDAAMAAQAWDNYRRRNDSVMVDHFQGLLKSTLVCPKCNSTSRKFDPFMYLSLPLPSTKTRTYKMQAIFVDGSRPCCFHEIEIQKSGVLLDLLQKLADKLGLKGGHAAERVMQPVEMGWGPQIKSLLKPDEKLVDISNDDELVIFIYPHPDDGPQAADRQCVYIWNRAKGTNSFSGGFTTAYRETLGFPFVLFLPKEALDPRLMYPAGTGELKQKTSPILVSSPLGRAVTSALRPFKRKREGDLDAAQPAADSRAPCSKSAANSGKAASSLRPSDIPAGAEDTAPAEAPDVSMAEAPQNGAGEASSDDSSGGGWLNVQPPEPESDDDPSGWPSKIPPNPSHGRPLSHGLGNDPNTWPGNQPCKVSSPSSGPQDVSNGHGRPLVAEALASLSRQSSGSDNRKRRFEAMRITPADDATSGQGPSSRSSSPSINGVGMAVAGHSSGGSTGTSGQSSQVKPGVPAATVGGRPTANRAASAGPSTAAGVGSQPHANAVGGPVPTVDGLGQQATSSGMGGVGGGASGAEVGEGSGRNGHSGVDPADAASSLPSPSGQDRSSPEAGKLPQRTAKASLTQNGARPAFPSSGAVPPAPPFDMFARQNLASSAHSDSPEGSDRDAAPAPFNLVQATSRGEFKTGYSITPLEHDDDVVNFAVDWGVSFGNDKGQGWPYDLQAIKALDNHKGGFSSNAPPAKAHQLSECLEAFLQPEQLDVTDTWYCGRCKSHVQADKKLDLWQLPEVLVIHLKRFSFSRSWRDKLEDPVIFPLHDLDLSSALLRPQAQPPVYDLFAVSNHFGGLGGGHYTAFCRDAGSDDWFNFDDSHVSPVPTGDSVVSPAAYMLFYRRQSDAASDSGADLTYGPSDSAITEAIGTPLSTAAAAAGSPPGLGSLLTPLAPRNIPRVHCHSNGHANLPPPTERIWPVQPDVENVGTPMSSSKTPSTPSIPSQIGSPQAQDASEGFSPDDSASDKADADLEMDGEASDFVHVSDQTDDLQ